MRFLSLTMLFLSIFALSTLTQSCQKAEDSTDVNQDKIHQYLELQYNALEDKTTAVAQFRFGNAIGTPLKLSGTAAVSVDGNTMTWNETLNRYEWTWTGQTSTAMFSYTDNDANTFVNTATMTDIAVAASVDTISKDSAYNLVWTGAPVGTDEEVHAVINEMGEINGTYTVQRNVGATSITIPKNNMTNIDVGQVSVWLSRDYKPAISQATDAGGIIVGKYLDIKQNVTLTN